MTGTARHARERDRRGFVPSPRGTAGRAAPDVRPAVRELDPAELVWMEECRELLRGPGLDLADVGWLGTLLDASMTPWHAASRPARWNPLPTITAVGIAAGDAVVSRVPGTAWVVVSGTGTFALAHPRTTTLELPLEAVEASWHDGTPGTLPTLVAELTDRALLRITEVDEPPRLTGALRLLGLRR
jgi:hypothetical protein